MPSPAKRAYVSLVAPAVGEDCVRDDPQEWGDPGIPATAVQDEPLPDRAAIEHGVGIFRSRRGSRRQAPPERQRRSKPQAWGATSGRAVEEVAARLLASRFAAKLEQDLALERPAYP